MAHKPAIDALPDDVQAAVDANVRGDAMRGLVVVIGTVVETINPAFLPSPPYAVVAALCEDLLRWVVAAGPMSPYAHVRSPIEAAGLSIWTVDLRKVRADTVRPDGVPEAVWPTVVAAAQRYREACPEQAMAADDMRLLEMRPEGRA